jgi:xylulokinase
MKYLLGIDVGTGGCKVAIYTDCYVKVESISSKYVSNTSKGGSSEQDPNLWWQYISESIRVLTEKYVSDPESSIGLIGVSCANAMIPVDSAGKVLRPALMQYDSRSAEILDQVKDISAYIDYPSITGNEPRSSMVSAVLLYWLKEFEAEIYEKTYKFLSPAGFIISRLTGEYSMDYSRASTTMLYNFKTRNWSESACESLGLDYFRGGSVYRALNGCSSHRRSYGQCCCGNGNGC